MSKATCNLFGLLYSKGLFMKRHERFEPMEYRHEMLLAELNEFMMDVKTHLFDLNIPRPKPTVQEMDNLMFRIMAALKEDARPMIRR